MNLNRTLFGLLCVLACGFTSVQAQTTAIETEYLLTLYAPLDAPQQIDSTLSIHNLGAGGWLDHVQCIGKMVGVKADEGSCVKYDIFVVR